MQLLHVMLLACDWHYVLNLYRIVQGSAEVRIRIHIIAKITA